MATNNERALWPGVVSSLNSVWNQLKASCNYDARKANVENYNRSNRWTKRGISLVPLKYGIAWAGAR